MLVVKGRDSEDARNRQVVCEPCWGGMRVILVQLRCTESDNEQAIRIVIAGDVFQRLVLLLFLRHLSSSALRSFGRVGGFCLRLGKNGQRWE